MHLTTFCLSGSLVFTIVAALAGAAQAKEWVKDGLSECSVWDEREEFNGTIRYTGDCAEGKAQGTGELTWSGKHFGKGKYTGNFRGGKFDGDGVYTAHNDLHYEGTFIAGNFEGQGVSTQPRKPMYIGNFKAGVPHGKGIWKDHRGDVYEGEFMNGLKHGQGSFKWARSGLRYVGPWRRGMRDGRGRFTLPNGETKIAIHDFGEPKVDWSNVPPDHDRRLCRFFLGTWSPVHREFRVLSERMTENTRQRQIVVEFETSDRDNEWQVVTGHCTFERRADSMAWKLVEGRIGEMKVSGETMKSVDENASVLLFAIYPEKLDF